MRNDARPVGGERSHQSPVVSHQSEVVGHQTGIYRPRPESPVDDKPRAIAHFDADDPVMPASDSTLTTKI